MSKGKPKTTTVQDFKKILAALPLKAPLYFGPSLIPLAGVTLDVTTKKLYIYSADTQAGR